MVYTFCSIHPYPKPVWVPRTLYHQRKVRTCPSPVPFCPQGYHHIFLHQIFFSAQSNPCAYQIWCLFILFLFGKLHAAFYFSIPLHAPTHTSSIMLFSCQWRAAHFTPFFWWLMISFLGTLFWWRHNYFWRNNSNREFDFG